MTTKSFITDGSKILQLEKSQKISFTPDELVKEHKGLVSTLKQTASKLPKKDKKLNELITDQSKELQAYKRGEKEDFALKKKPVQHQRHLQSGKVVTAGSGATSDLRALQTKRDIGLEDTALSVDNVNIGDIIEATGNAGRVSPGDQGKILSKDEFGRAIVQFKFGNLPLGDNGIRFFKLNKSIEKARTHGAKDRQKRKESPTRSWVTAIERIERDKKRVSPSKYGTGNKYADKRVTDDFEKGLPWFSQKRKPGKGKGKTGLTWEKLKDLAGKGEKAPEAKGAKELREHLSDEHKPIKDIKETLLTAFQNAKDSGKGKEYIQRTYNMNRPEVKAAFDRVFGEHKAPSKPESPEWREGYMRAKMGENNSYEKSVFMRKKK